MCLQWCHVRNILIDNDLSCAVWCPDETRRAHQHARCQDCPHYQPFRARGLRGTCTLTHEMVPLSQTCCHYHASVNTQPLVTLHLGTTVLPELLQAHGIATVRELFRVIESAPELPPEPPSEAIPIRMAQLTLPLVYGVAALCWEKALYGVDEGDLCPEVQP
jgi:hypothetical protein